jgi:hydroxypyruvate isomerase
VGTVTSAMPRFSANLTFGFTEVAFLERFGAAGDLGFRAVEFMFPYEHRAAEIEGRLREAGLVLDLFNLPAGDFAAGERGTAVYPVRRTEFSNGVDLALEYAQVLGTTKLNCLVGLRDPALAWEEQYDCLVSNLRWAAARVGAAGATLLVEHLNVIETPGFFLDSLDLAERLLDDVGSAHLRLQFDAYHVERTQGDVISAIRRHIDRVGHVQIADAPGRHEPGTGTMDYPAFFVELDRLGYRGRVGLEYKPSGMTADSLGWVEAYGLRIDE